MKSLLFLAAAAVFAGPAMADADLAQKKKCMACHAIGKKVVGPAFKDVAKKYAGDKGAVARLSEKVRKGGGGVWGGMAMLPNPQVNEEEAKTLVKWVLSLE